MSRSAFASFGRTHTARGACQQLSHDAMVASCPSPRPSVPGPQRLRQGGCHVRGSENRFRATSVRERRSAWNRPVGARRDGVGRGCIEEGGSWIETMRGTGG